MPLNVGGSDSLYWRTGLDTTGLQAGAVKSKGILSLLSRQVTGMDIFAGLGIGAAMVFAKITKQAYNFAKDFETAMKEVQTISKAVQDNYKGISQEIINMSKTVPDSAQKLTKALYQIVSAGYDGKKAMDILKVSAELAVAGVTDTFTAADAMTYIMNSFGEAAGDAENIAGKLFMTVKLGKTRMEELAPAVSKVAGMWAQAGGSFEDLMASIATGVKSLPIDIMTTAIRGILTAIISPGQEAKDMIKELGIEFDAATLKTKGFSYIILEMQKAVGNDVDKMEKLAAIFPNIRGLIGALALDADKYTASLDAMAQGTEEFNKATKTMIDTTENQFAILHNNLMAKLKPLGDSILKTMNNMAKGINIAMSGATDELSNMSRVYSELTDTLRKKKSRIDELTKTIEDLQSKTKLTKEETVELTAAEKALGVYYPTLGENINSVTGEVNLLSAAKKDLIDLSKEIAELELKQAKIAVIQAKLDVDQYNLGKDESNKTIEGLKKQIKAIKDYIEVGEGQFQFVKTDKERIQKQNELLVLEGKLALATEGRVYEGLKLNLIYDATIEKEKELNRLIAGGKPIVIPKPPKGKGPDKDTITTVNIEEVEAQLKYMASQYKLYLSDIAARGEDWVKENNALLFKEGSNYAQFLSDMAVMYQGNAELNRQISDDIYEYNKTITEKKKKLEDELYEYITEARKKDLKAEEDIFESIIKNYEEGSTEYLSAVEKHNKNILEINDKYNKEIAEAAFTIFKEGLERQIGETDKLYKVRLETARAGLYKETEANKEYYEFVTIALNKIAIKEKEAAKEKRELLDSYFAAYQTIEEKIVSIHKKTAELLLLTDDKYEKERLKNIEERLIAEIEYGEASEEIFGGRDKNIQELNNQQLENYIAFLEEMKLKYSNFAELMIEIDEKIYESQKQIWENVRSEIDDTVSALHNLADAVGNFDTELEKAINDLADLVSGIGNISIGFSIGGIGGIATALGGIATVIGSIINLFVKHKSDVPELQEELAGITLELQKQQNILNQATGMAETAAIKERITLLQKQIDVYNDLIAAEEAAYGQFLWWTWDETNQEAIDNWLSSIESINAEIFNLNQQYQEILTGTTAETIADAIAEGFSQGLDSAQVFADTFNDMMKKAIMDAFKRTIITQHIQNWLEGFANLTEGGLTPGEIDYAASTYLILLSRIETKWEAIQAVLEAAGIELEGVAETISDVTGLTGAIAGITEETAGLLAGQFMAIRINTVEILGNMESIIIINSQIAEHTSYNRYLENIWNKMNAGGSLENETLRSIGG